MIYFYNLTNGLENAPLKNQPHLIRIQSSHVEGNHWNQLFYKLSDELLFYLAIGEECIIIDGSPKPLRSKIVTKAIPLISYVLNRIWFRKKTPILLLPTNILTPSIARLNPILRKN